MQAPPTWGSQWSQAVHTCSKESRAYSVFDQWSVHWSQNRNTGRKLVERKGIFCPVLLFWATYQGFMTRDCAEGKGLGKILRSIKYENKNTSTLLLLLMFITTSSQAECLWQSGEWVVSIFQSVYFLEPFCKANKWLEKLLFPLIYYSHAFPRLYSPEDCQLPLKSKMFSFLKNVLSKYSWFSVNFCWTAKWFSYTVVCVLSCFSHVRLCDPWTVAHQAPLSMGVSRQEYWSGLLCPPPGDLPDWGIELESLMSSCTGRRVLYHWRHLGSHIYICSFSFLWWFITEYWIYFPVLYSRTLLFIYTSLHLLIPNSQSFFPQSFLPLDNHKSVLFISEHVSVS